MPRLLQGRVAWAWWVFAAGFLLSFLPIARHHSVAQGDEIFQSVEQAHRLVFGYGILTWEFAYGTRSWILALLSAGPMAIARTLHAGPQLYLPLTAAVFALVGATATACVFLRAEKFFGIAGAAGAAVASALWIDNIYFGARSLGEPLAAHLLVIAVCLAAPPVTSKRAPLLLGGFLAAAAFLVRIQIAPAIALLWLWPPFGRQRFLLLTAGAILALAADAVLDATTWGVPFLPMWQNFHFNFVLNGAAHFGTDPWSTYFRFMAYNWGASAVPFLVLALLGARRMPILFAMAAIIIASHMLIGHKEFRFIFPALAMLSVLAGFGLVDFTRILAYGLGSDRSIPAPAGLAVLVGIGWTAISLLNVIGRGYQHDWDRSSGILDAELRLSRTAGICGVGFDTPIAWTGGYAYLHRPVPLYAFKPDLQSKDIEAANAVVASPSFSFGTTGAKLYRKQQCFTDQCVFLRPGGCTPLPRVPLPSGPLTSAVVDAYVFPTQVFP